MVSLPSSTRQSPVLDVAVEQFLEQGWIDMRALAQRAGIGRATLYRHYADRDAVLAAVLWELTRRAADSALVGAPGPGKQRVLHILRGIMTAVVSLPAIRMFVTRNPDYALKILMSQDGAHAPRLLAELEAFLLAELGPPEGFTARQLAYAVLRITDSFCYSDVLLGETPDIDAAVAIIDRML